MARNAKHLESSVKEKEQRLTNLNTDVARLWEQYRSLASAGREAEICESNVACCQAQMVLCGFQARWQEWQGLQQYWEKVVRWGPSRVGAWVPFT